jgi:hypothetical protein
MKSYLSKGTYFMSFVVFSFVPTKRNVEERCAESVKNIKKIKIKLKN